MAITMSSRVSLPAFDLAKIRSAGSPRSTAERMWLAGGVLAGLVLIAIGYLALIGPQRSDTSAVRAQVSQARSQQAALASRIALLQSQNKNLAQYEAQYAAAQAALPAGSGVANLLRSLQSAGAATSTTISSLSVGTPTPVVAASATTAPAATTPAPAATGVYSMTVNAQVSGSAGNLDRFLQQVQQVQPRALLITQLAQTGATAGGSDSLALTMTAFMMPATAAGN